METTIEKTAEVLNDLIIINNDRCEGYEKAREDVNDADLKDFFSTYSNQSRDNNAELRALVPASEKTPDQDDTTLAGKFHRAWMGVKNAMDEGDRKKILSSCESGEDAAKAAYEGALDDSDELPANVVATIKKQYNQILVAHNQVKTLRDSA